MKQRVMEYYVLGFILLGFLFVMLSAYPPSLLTGSVVLSRQGSQRFIEVAPQQFVPVVPIEEPAVEQAVVIDGQPLPAAVPSVQTVQPRSSQPASLLDLLKNAISIQEPEEPLPSNVVEILEPGPESPSAPFMPPQVVPARSSPVRKNPHVISSRARFFVEKKVAQELDVGGTAVVLIHLDPESPLLKGATEKVHGRELPQKERVKMARDAVKASVLQSAAAMLQGAVLEVDEEYEHLPVMAVRIDTAALEALSSLPGIKAVHADRSFGISVAQSLPAVKAPMVWDQTVDGHALTGAGQSICVLDTGVDMAHPAFAGRLLPGFDVVANTPVVSDRNGHGTHVAGIAASMAPQATLIPIKVCADDGTCRSSDVIAGIDFCLNASANVSALTGSFGDGGMYDPASCPTTVDLELFAARNASVLPVFAAGNNGSLSGVTYPACSPYVLSVGASSADGSIALFSNRGPGLELLAPGVQVNSTLPGSRSGVRSGTSVAVPFVAGAAALLKDYAVHADQTAGASRVEQALLEGSRNVSGWRILDAAAALEVFPSIPESGVAPPALPPNQSEQTFQVLVNPVVINVNITTITPNRTMSTACVWNYTDSDGDAENGTTWTWFVNNSEGWRDASLVSYWHLDQNALDAMGINNGSIVNATNTSGVMKTGLFFDGVSAYVEGGNHTSLNMENATTVIAWVRSAGATSSFDATFVDKGDPNGNSRGYALGIAGSTQPRAHRALFFVQGTKLNATTPLNDSKWHHLAGVMNSSRITLFVDSIEEDAVSVSTTLEPGRNNLTLGARVSPSISSFFNGSLDEVKIFNRSLSWDEVANDYQMMYYGSTEKDLMNKTPAPDVPSVVWHFDDNGSSNSSFDFFGDNIAVTSNATRVQGVFGTLGFSFNGTNAMLVANHSQSMNVSGNFTMMLWAATGDGANVGYMVSKFAAGVFPSYGIVLNNTVVACIVTNATGNVSALSTIPTDSTFHHIACVQNVTALAIYRDGALQNWTGTAGAVNISANKLFVGSLDGTSRFFNGTIDELEIYTGPMTREEVNQSAARSFPLFGINYSVYGRNTSLNCEVEPIQTDGTAGTPVNSSSPTTVSPNRVPAASRVNITPYGINTSISPAGTWNYTDENDFDPENGTTWTWFINNTEGWRDNNLLAYWRLEGNSVDARGQFNGTALNGTITNETEGVIKGALSFDSVNAYVNVSDSASWNLYNFTLIAWVKMRGENAFNGIIAHDNDSNEHNKWIWEYGSGGGRNATSFHINNLTSANTWVKGNGWNITRGRWYHLVMVRNGANFTFYRDGLMDGRDNYSGGIPLPDASSPLTIGWSENANRYWNGSLDEIKIFNRSLTDDEVTYDYQMMYYGSTEKEPVNGTPAPDIPVSLWHFDDNQSGSNTYDYFGDLVGVVNATPVQGVFGTQAFAFNGSSFGASTTYIAVNDPSKLNFSGNLTILLWMATGDANNKGYMLSKYNHQFTPSYGVLINNSIVSCQISNATSNQTASAKITADNTFHHIACVYNATSLAIYVNGSFSNAAPFAGAINYSGNGSLFFGAFNFSAVSHNLSFNGTLDEIELHNRPFSAEEINQSFRRSYPLFGINRSFFGQNSSITFQIEPIQYDGAAGSAVNSTTISSGIVNNPTASRVNITPFAVNKSISPAGVWNYSDPEGDVENGSTWTWFVNTSEVWRDSSLVSYWRFDADGNDTLGRNNGTMFNVTVVSGVIKNAFNFTGNISNVTVGNDSSLNFQNFTTIMFWIKTAGLTSSADNAGILDKGGDAGYSFYLPNLLSPIANQIAFRVNRTILPSVVQFTDDEWHHVAGTYDGSLMTIYVDAVVENTSAKSDLFNPGATGPLAMGKFANGTSQFRGSLDEVKIFNRSLTLDEVRYEYFMMAYGSTEKVPTNATPAWDVPLAAWHFDDASSSTSAFDYFGDVQAIVSNATPVRGMFGTQGMAFNGVNTTLAVNYSALWNLTTNFTVIAWMASNDSANVGFPVSKHHSGRLSTFAIRYNYSVVSCIVSNDSANQTASFALAADGAFHQVACVMETLSSTGPQSLLLYINGSVRNATGSSTPLFAPLASANNLFFGSLDGTSSFFNGSMDEVEVYSQVLTGEEINQSYQRPFPLFGINSSRFGRNDSLTLQLEPVQTNGSPGTAVNSTSIATTTVALPVAFPVNITPSSMNRSISPAGVWNYTDEDNDAENGTTWTWFINNSEGWRSAGLISYWRLDGDGLDVVGRSNGSIVGATNTTGVIKSALGFNGLNQYVNLTSSVSNFPNGSSNRTVCAWAKTNAVDADYHWVFEYGKVSANNMILLGRYGDTLYGSGNNNDFQVDDFWKINQWQHICLLFDGANVSLYGDGLFLNSTAKTAWSTVNEQAHIGATKSAVPAIVQVWNGSIDEVKLFNRTLGSDEIAYDYYMMYYGSTEKEPVNGTPAPDVPVALWHFDEDSGATSSFDFFGDGIAVRSNVSRTQGVFGTIGASFNGANTLLAANHTPQLNQSGNFTISVWMLSNDGANVGYVVSKQSASVFPTYAVRLNNSVASCQVSNATGNQTASSTVNVADGAFHHIACTYNATNLAIYVDGIPRNATRSIGVLNSSTGALLIGSQTGTAGFFNGTIDELEVYNRPFTAEEINQSFRRPFPLFGLNHSVLGRNSTITFQVEPIQYNATAGLAVNSSTLTTTPAPPDCGSIEEDMVVSFNLSSNGTCITFNNYNIALNCSGYTIRGNGSGSLVVANNLANITIRDCHFLNATMAIDEVNVTVMRIVNNTFGATALRIVQNSTTAQNTTIILNRNLSNLTLGNVVNTTVENNTMQLVSVATSGPGTHLAESNRYVNNTLLNGWAVLNDSVFRFERNIIINHSWVDILGVGALVFNNTWRNSSLNATRGDGGSSSRILANAFASNGTENGQCISIGTSGINQTIGNNTLLQCGMAFANSGGANSTVLDHTIDINVTSANRLAAVYVLNATDIFFNNMTINMNSTANNPTDGFRIIASRNISIANSTVLNLEQNHSGIAVRINASNYTLIAQSGLNSFNATVELSGFWIFDTKLTNNRLAERTPDRTPCLVLGRESSDQVNRTIIRGNVFNCTSAIIVSDGSALRVADLNVSDNTFRNGTVIVGQSSPVHAARFLNNSFTSQRGARAALELINATGVMVANNTFGNVTGGVWIYPDAENSTVFDNVFANSSIGINASGGIGLFIWNASFVTVRNPMILDNALNGTVNNTRAPNFTVIKSSGVGVINFTAGVNFTRNVSLLTFLNISNNTIYLNSSMVPELNASANMFLYDIVYIIPKVRLRESDNQTAKDCPASRCVNTSFDNVTFEFGFNVSSFSGFGGGPESAPQVVNESPNNSIFSPNTFVNISANVTDTGTIDTVFANVTIPNSSFFLVRMLSSGVADIYNGTFNVTGEPGMYTVRFVATDTAEYVNATEFINFSISGAPVSVNVLSVSCSQAAALNDQVVCAVSAKLPDNGSALPGVIIFYNVTNATGALIVRGNATDIGAGTYRVNFSAPAQGGYVVSVAQNGTSFGASTATMVRTVFSIPRVLATGTLFFPESRIVVDAIFLSADGVPLRSAGCNLSLMDQNLSVVQENQTMPEIDAGGIAHYVYNKTNATNMTANMTEGIFFGHVRCHAAGSTGGVAFARVGFEVRRFNQSSSSGSADVTDALVSLNSTRDVLRNLLNRQGEFSQEQVFLVTDAFNSLSDLSQQVLAGQVSAADAADRIAKLNQTLAQKLGDKYHKVTSAPLSRPVETEVRYTSAALEQKAAPSRKWLVMVLLVLVGLALFLIPVVPRKHHHEHR